MSKRVWKYQLSITDWQALYMPIGAVILSVQEQFGDICLWAMVDSEEEIYENRIIIIVGTGNPAEHVDPINYIGTVQTHDGSLVWHVFENR